MNPFGRNIRETVPGNPSLGNITSREFAKQVALTGLQEAQNFPQTKVSYQGRTRHHIFPVKTGLLFREDGTNVSSANDLSIMLTPDQRQVEPRIH